MVNAKGFFNQQLFYFQSLICTLYKSVFFFSSAINHSYTYTQKTFFKNIVYQNPINICLDAKPVVILYQGYLTKQSVSARNQQSLNFSMQPKIFVDNNISYQSHNKTKLKYTNPTMNLYKFCLNSCKTILAFPSLRHR